MQRRRILRSRADQHFCRYCARPSTPAEQAAFKRWRKALDTVQGMQQQIAVLVGFLRNGDNSLMYEKDGKALASALERVFESKPKEMETSSAAGELQEVHA